MLACICLIGLLGLQWFLPYGDPQIPVAGLATRHPRLVSAPSMTEYPDILRAPIFAPDRRPGETEGPGAASLGVLGAYAVLGAASGPGFVNAVINGPAGAKVVRKGETVEGWTVVAVDKDKVTFERKGVRHSLAIGVPAQGVAPDKAATADE